VCQIGARKSRGAACNDRDIHIVGQRNLADVNGENAFAAFHIGSSYNDAAIESAGPEQSRIENIGTIGCGNQDDAFVRFEPVHLDEQLVQRLFAFIVSAAKPCATVAADRVDFIDEDDARGVFLALFEQIADT